ncbi:general substrate transporter [Polychaeton citri CBS 116435]|uniref:General substrate transporter n=1 Tax=Polychaeton citri CBS 116435 TaxID=1314669 RepID=A0A9P4UR65_9PEZI|nr:general substrate transporter [Polychaeton citri CBS 116435]
MGLILKKPPTEEGAAWPSICVGFFAAFAGILYGYDTGTISGIQSMNYWVREFDNPSEGRLSLIVSILSVGTFVGALSAGFLADYTGRKWGIILSAAFPFNLGVILQTAATEQKMFIAGRFFAGLGVGLISVQIPMFQAETLPKWIRGFVIGSYQLCITIGLLLAALINYGTQNMNNSGSYRIPLAIQFAWSLILTFGMLILPETPRFLIKSGQDDKAYKSLTFLRRLPRDHPAIISEHEEIKGNYAYELSLGSASYVECFKGNIGKRTMTGIGIQALQQLVGVNFIFYYGTSYFANLSGSGLPNKFILQVITNVVNVVSTFPGLWAIDAFGRRTVLLVGALGMGVSQYIVAACGAATPTTNDSSVAAQFAFICIYIFFFASTFGPGAWVVTGEIFPLKVRAKCISMTTASNWFFNWLLAFITPYLEGADYADLKSNVFWIWGGFCWIAVVFVFFLVYETKGLSLEQVQELYETETRAWKTVSKRDMLHERRFSVTEPVVEHTEKEKHKLSDETTEERKEATIV